MCETPGGAGPWRQNEAQGRGGRGQGARGAIAGGSVGAVRTFWSYGGDGRTTPRVPSEPPNVQCEVAEAVGSGCVSFNVMRKAWGRPSRLGPARRRQRASPGGWAPPDAERGRQLAGDPVPRLPQAARPPRPCGCRMTESGRWREPSGGGDVPPPSRRRDGGQRGASGPACVRDRAVSSGAERALLLLPTCGRVD